MEIKIPQNARDAQMAEQEDFRFEHQELVDRTWDPTWYLERINGHPDFNLGGRFTLLLLLLKSQESRATFAFC